MRPLHLELTAFGPYPGKQAIDFTELGGSDLFLIHGPTGSGKTSIFDGLTYALFGKLAGSRGVDRIRADRADKDLQTQVVFRFRMGDLAYRVERTPEWERPRKRGGGTTTQPAGAGLWREGDDLPVATGATDVTKAVVDILGMDVDQFTQVALLPQGEFKRLLCADSKERETLLKRLFATDRYVDIENLLVERKKRLEADNEKLKAHRSEVLGGETQEALVERLGEVRAKIESAGATAGVLRLKAAEASKVLVEAKQVSAKFEERDEARTIEARASAEAQAARADGEQLGRARSAERVRDRLDRVVKAEADEGRRIREERDAEVAEKQATEQLAKAEVLARAAEAEKPERARISTRIAQLDVAMPDLERLRGLDAACTAAEAKAGEAKGKVEKLGQALLAAEQRTLALADEGVKLRPLAVELPARQDAARSLDEALRGARDREKLRSEVDAQVRTSDEASRSAMNSREAATKAMRGAERLHAQREERLAAWLAQTALQDGKACPVCGSLDHPAPAQAEGHIPDEGEVNEARATAEVLGRSAAEAESARDVAAGLLEELRRRLDDATKREAREVATLEAEHALAASRQAEARSANERLAKLEKELGESRAAADDARVRRDQAAGEASVAQEAAAKADASRAELRRQLDALGVGPAAAEEVRKLRDDLQKREKRAKDALDGHQCRDHPAGPGRHGPLAGPEGARRFQAGAHRGARGGQRRVRRRGVPRHRRVHRRRSSRSPGRTSSRPRSTSASPCTSRRGSGSRSSRRALSGLTPPDVALAQAERDGAEKAAREAGEERVRFEQEAAGLAGRVKRLEELQAQADDIAEKLKVAGHVAELVRGSNPKAMSLHRFVLAARLEEVAEAASERLTVMTKGRFRLLHDTSVARKNSAAGLSLVVEDTWTGTRDRPVGALSGGESFLASLSLALGLSDVVLRHSGGRRLDALFVDEGFGTLDEATLDVAIQALETLPQAGRLVGVISHVAELRRRIPARIEVTSTETGAVATVRAG